MLWAIPAQRLSFGYKEDGQNWDLTVSDDTAVIWTCFDLLWTLKTI